MTKADLRKEARARRRDFVKAKQSAAFPTKGTGVAALEQLLAPSSCIAGYRAMHSEADPANLLQHLAHLGHKLALPWIGDDGSAMLFRRWGPSDPLELAVDQFEQPLADAEACAPDIILLPLLGFDRAGNRLGQGAGHYDRALAHLPNALRIGLAWSVQEFAALPADAWDIPLDAILTEAEWIATPYCRITS
ncbi:MAG: 5-formyltetrahydrofolate cyclo-ligase [Chakrabartia sp.]